MLRFWRYVLRTMARHRVRTALTVVGVAVAVFIVTYLYAIYDSRSQLVARASQTVLVVHEKDVY